MNGNSTGWPKKQANLLFLREIIQPNLHITYFQLSYEELDMETHWSMRLEAGFYPHSSLPYKDDQIRFNLGQLLPLFPLKFDFKFRLAVLEIGYMQILVNLAVFFLWKITNWHVFFLTLYFKILVIADRPRFPWFTVIYISACAHARLKLPDRKKIGTSNFLHTLFNEYQFFFKKDLGKNVLKLFSFATITGFYPSCITSHGE